MRDKLVKDLRKAFNGKLKDVCKDFTLQRIQKGGVDPLTDENLDESILTFAGYGAFLRPNKTELLDPLLDLSDRKIMVLQDDFTATPKIGDEIMGQRVFRVTEDPTSAIWKIYTRASSNGME